jgi:hypothetical protein
MFGRPGSSTTRVFRLLDGLVHEFRDMLAPQLYLALLVFHEVVDPIQRPMHAVRVEVLLVCDTSPPSVTHVLNYDRLLLASGSVQIQVDQPPSDVVLVGLVNASGRNWLSSLCVNPGRRRLALTGWFLRVLHCSARYLRSGAATCHTYSSGRRLRVSGGQGVLLV